MLPSFNICIVLFQFGILSIDFPLCKLRRRHFYTHSHHLTQNFPLLPIVMSYFLLNWYNNSVYIMIVQAFIVDPIIVCSDCFSLIFCSQSSFLFTQLFYVYTIKISHVLHKIIKPLSILCSTWSNALSDRPVLFPPWRLS